MRPNLVTVGCQVANETTRWSRWGAANPAFWTYFILQKIKSNNSLDLKMMWKGDNFFFFQNTVLVIVIILRPNGAVISASYIIIFSCSGLMFSRSLSTRLTHNTTTDDRRIQISWTKPSTHFNLISILQPSSCNI